MLDLYTPPATVATSIITFLAGNPYKPVATVTRWGLDQNYMYDCMHVHIICNSLVKQNNDFFQDVPGWWMIMVESNQKHPWHDQPPQSQDQGERP